MPGELRAGRACCTSAGASLSGNWTFGAAPSGCIRGSRGLFYSVENTGGPHGGVALTPESVARDLRRSPPLDRGGERITTTPFAWPGRHLSPVLTFTVHDGSVDVVEILPRAFPNRATIRMRAGPSGATITGLQLRAVLRSSAAGVAARRWHRTRPALPCGVSGGRRTRYGRTCRRRRRRVSPTRSSRRARSARRSWRVQLDADRGPDEEDAALGIEIVDVVRTAIDSALDEVGECLRVEHAVGEGGTFATYLTMLELATQPVATAPGKPGRPVLLASGDTALVTSWAAPSDGGSIITSYRLQWREQGQTGWPNTVNQLGTFYTIAGLSAGTTYEARVRATNAIGTGPWSDIGSGTTGVIVTGSRLRLQDGSAFILQDGSGVVLLQDQS